MKQWDVYQYRFEKEGLHPAVILSNDERGYHTDLEAVNALLRTSAKLNREPRKHEVILDDSDGLDWKTAVRCDVMYLLPKSGFERHQGSVSPIQRREVARKIVQAFRLPVT
jgi:mRNA-degrading endonuclease toxin of MazEF toxin-antitoxin module